MAFFKLFFCFNKVEHTLHYNKKEIINLAVDIGTYDLSILPYEDCCSFFVPKHPETKAKLDIIEEIEKDITLDFDNLYNNIEKITIIGE